MEKNQTERKMKSLKNLLIGSSMSLVLSLILLLGFSVLMVNTDIKESTIQPVIILVSSICILIGSMFAARKNQKNGMVNGGVVGAIYLSVLWIVSSIFIQEMSFTMQTLIMLFASILTGLLGGILGVNFAKTK